MEFKFDEFAVETKFRDRLDEYMLGARTVRPNSVGPELGSKIIMLDKLVKQDNPDVIKIIIRQLVEALSIKLAMLQATTSRVLLVDPLQFEYVRGRFDSNGKRLEGPGKKNATEVFVTTKIEELEQ
ncbi:hypothetical protein LCGC14_1133360 [marine sediment metagenome]|uniref:Uncharacterized protein n=1 Tax=marine sediment metagenome TaxID=412755 RepID=A0A0F9M0G8_9ZZZZ